MSDTPDLGALAADAHWVRGLARELVADPGLADDLAQDTWVAALRNRTRPAPMSRGWLATILRRRLFERRREDGARADREARVARPEALPSTLDMVERASVQRDLVAAVLQLEEPYRTTVLWRYFENLPPREIAARAGIPVATVHTRIARARERLRARLDEAWHGGRGGWLAALVPLSRVRDTNWIGALLMKTSTKAALAAAALTATVSILAVSRWERASSAEPRDVVRAEPGALRGDDRPPPAPAPATEEPARAVVDVAREAPATPAVGSAAAAAPVLHGRVLDEHGRPLAGVRLTTRPAPPRDARIVSESDGRFALALEGRPTSVVSADERLATVLAGSASTVLEALVVVAPRVRLEGRVVDEDGAPLRGVAIAVRLPHGFGADFGIALDSALTNAWETTSDESGAFALGEAPSLEGAVVAATLSGFGAHLEPVPGPPGAHLEIVLRRATDADARVRGIVLDPAGAFVPGARVALGAQSVFSDAGGRFELDTAQHPRPTRLLAVLRGFQPGVYDLDGPKWPAEVVLRLGSAPLSIRGRVVDGAGKGVDHARVWIADPTPFGIVENEPLHVEALADKDDLRFWAYAETDAGGAFELAGLLVRDYRLVALDPRTLVQSKSEPIAAGSRDVVLRLPADATWPRLSGRVVASDGEGIADVSVQVQRPAFEFTFPDGGTRDDWSHREPVRTDAHGRFEFADVPRAGTELFAFGDPILFASVAVESIGDPSDVTIRAERRMHLQIELDAPHERADSARVLDASEKPLILRIMRGDTSFTNRTTKLIDGRSEVLSLSDQARTLVLLRGDEEVARIPVQLARDRVNLVCW